MAEPITSLPRWPFDAAHAHLCEGCGGVCEPGIEVCPRCSTRLGEFSRPIAPTPKPQIIQKPQQGKTEALCRCPHCGQAVSVMLG